MEIKINKNPVGVLEMYFTEERNGKTYVATPVEVNMKEYEVGMMLQPTLSFPHLFAGEILKALAEELDSKGIKTDKDAKIEGTLNVTRYHLEDMRSLLKLNKGK